MDYSGYSLKHLEEDLESAKIRKGREEKEIEELERCILKKKARQTSTAADKVAA